MTAAPTLAELAQAEAHHATRYGRGDGHFIFEGRPRRITSWLVITEWNVVLSLEGGTVVQVDPNDAVVKVRRPGEKPTAAPVEETPTLVGAEEDPRQRRAMLSGEAPTQQLSFGGGAFS